MTANVLNAKRHDVFAMPQKPEPMRVAVAAAIGHDQHPSIATEYHELMQKLGMKSHAVTVENDNSLRMEVLRFMQLEEIRIYPLAKVSAFMDALVENINCFEPQPRPIIWCWRPLRQADINRLPTEFRQGGIDNTLYPHPVPIEALRLAEKVHDAFGERVGLYVTDYAVTTPDPFLAIIAPGLEPIVIAVWNEPGFTTRS